MRYSGEWNNSAGNSVFGFDSVGDNRLFIYFKPGIISSVFDIPEVSKTEKVIVFYYLPEEEEYYNLFNEIRNLFISDQIYRTLTFKDFILDDAIKKIDKLIDLFKKEPVYYLIKAFLLYYKGDFNEALTELNNFIDRLRDCQYKEKFSEYIVNLIKNNSGLLEKYIKTTNGFIKRSISLVGCNGDEDHESFRWTKWVYDAIDLTNQVNTDLYVSKNNVYLHNSFYYSTYKNVFKRIDSNSEYIVLSCHSGTTLSTGMRLSKEALLQFYFKKNIVSKLPFELIYKYIREKLKSNAIIMILGCDMHLDSERYKNVIYFREFVNGRKIVPFVYSYFINILFNYNPKTAVNLAVIFSSLFDENIEKVTII